MKKISIVLFIVVCILALTGCGSSTEDIASTVESEVAMQVQSTIDSLPSATPVDTATPEATFTPQATYTPYPTLTSMPTFTPLPTYTPFPTLEPTLEDTPTAVPTATSALIIQPTSSSPAPTTSNLETMRTALANMLGGMDNYRSTFFQRRGDGTDLFSSPLPVDCHANIAARNQVISNILTLEVSDDIPEIQNAYAVYRDVAQRFAETTLAWNEGCLSAIADGTPEKGIDTLQKTDISNKISDFQNSLNNVNSPLLTIEE